MGDTAAAENSSSPGDADAVGAPTRLEVAALYQRYHADMLAVAEQFFHGRHPADAENALMSVFTRLLTMKAENRLLEPRAGWRAYLLRAVRNECVTIIRTDLAPRPDDPDDTTGGGRVGELDPVGDEMADGEDDSQQVLRLQRALETLTDRQRLMLRRKYWDNWNNQQIGRELGITGQAVGQKLATTYKKLLKEVGQHD